MINQQINDNRHLKTKFMTSCYSSYLLRIWRTEKQNDFEWFASLEDPKSRKVIYFKSLEQMFAFIREIQTLEDHCSHDLTEQ